MNSKLLKVCAAVMLVAGMGSVFGNTGTMNETTEGGEISSTERQKFVSCSAVAKVEAKVKAVVVVDFQGEKQALSLVDENGQVEEDEGKRSFLFNVKNIAEGYGIKITGENGLSIKGKQAYLSGKNGRGLLGISAELKDGDDTPVGFEWNKVMNFSNEHKAGQWRLILDTDVSDSTIVDDYVGDIKISIVAVK